MSRIWFNEGLANVYDALRLIREADVHRELTLLTSHTSRLAPVLTLGDELWEEPRRPTPEAYVEWCLAQCRERGVDLFWAGRMREALADARDRFEAQGTRLLVAADAPTMRLLELKDAFMARVSAAGVAIPEYRVFRNVAQLDAAWAELRPRHRRLCIKPVTGVYGSGFHILVEGRDPDRRLTTVAVAEMEIGTLRKVLARSRKPKKLLLMEFLSGAERSVDCIAHRGQLVAAVSRVKYPDHQRLEVTGPAVEMARRLTELFGLTGMYNVQTRERRGGGPRILEINSRMSGGMLQTALAGVPLPYWALMLALERCRPEDVPQPRGGGRVARVNAAVLVGRPDDPPPPRVRARQVPSEESRPRTP